MRDHISTRPTDTKYYSLRYQISRILFSEKDSYCTAPDICNDCWDELTKLIVELSMIRGGKSE